LRSSVFTSIAVLTIASAASAQTPEPPHLTVSRVARQPHLADLEPMEPLDASLGMQRIEGFVQRFPNDGSPVSERTLAYVGYDDEFIYVAFLCFDSAPDRVGAHLVQRDSLPNDEDSVAVHFDTFRDLKHAYGFQVNARGVQTEGIYTEGQGWDLSWDTVWRSEGKQTPRGYVVLFSIPFKSLRFPSTEKQTWGMFFYRAIARKNEQVYWPECSTRVAARFRQAAVVDGIERVSPGRNVQAIPYVSSRSFRAMDVAPTGRASFVSKTIEGTAGVDAKAVVRESLVLDATINPDFSQVESDQPQVTVNKPFEVFFPEKRPFFLENATYFNTPIQLLFTRRVADPMVGGRATGRMGRYAVGAMVVDDRSPADARSAGEPAWFGVGRVIRDVGRESSIGAFVSDRTSGDASNRVAAIDARIKVGANWFAAGQGVVADTARDAGSNGGTAAFASLVGAGRRFNYELDYNDRSPSFRAVNGFIPRVDIRSIDQTYSFRARPAGRTLQAWGPDIVVNRTWDYAGQPLDWSVTPRFELQWPGTTTFNVYYTAARQTLRPSEVPAAAERFESDVSRAGATFTSAALPRIIGSAALFAGRAPNLTPVNADPSEGRIVDATASVTVRLSRSLMLDLSYLFDRLRDSHGGAIYANTITRVRVGEQFTRAASLRAIVQWNELNAESTRTALQSNRNVNYDLLFAYLVSPGTAVYLGANYNLADIDTALVESRGAVLRSASLNNTGWQLFTKISYLLRR
jgi:hypothetical protein